MNHSTTQDAADTRPRPAVPTHSLAIRRGFRRLAAAVAVPILIFALLPLAGLISHEWAPLYVWDGEMTHKVPRGIPDVEASQIMVAGRIKEGKPPLPATRSRAASPATEGFPFSDEIMKARWDRSDHIAKSTEQVVQLVGAALGWVIICLALSWIIRGFIRDEHPRPPPPLG